MSTADNSKGLEIRDESQARYLFWMEAPASIRRYHMYGQRQNAYPTDVRVAWVEWVDAAQRGGRMSAELAQEVTL